MAPRARVISSSSSNASPSRPPETALEIAYNTAVQSFVRRDHAKTQASLSRLLGLANALPRSKNEWYELDVSQDVDTEGDEWRIKVLKLVISANASLYADPPANPESLDPDLVLTLPPSQPSSILKRTKTTCMETHPGLLPPSVISTLLLASLKLQPPSSALDFAHRLSEDWLEGLPDYLMRTLSTTAKSNSQSLSPQAKKRIEGTKEGYLKVIELFVGEVLAREGEFGMARSLLDGDEIMSSKRKEGLYRHLRMMETKMQASASSSPSSSGILPPQSPSASLVLPQSTSQSRDRISRSRSSTASSSSSERTARPKLADQPTIASICKSAKLGQRESQTQSREMDVERGSVDTNSTFHVPDKIYINPSSGSPSSSSPRNTGKGQPHYNLGSLLGLLPVSLRKRLLSPWFIASISPLPIIFTILTLLYIRRRCLRLGGSAASAGLQATSVLAERSSVGVYERLKRARSRGYRSWIFYWLQWWWGKIVGTWKMGTTISYL
jgi:hypothetical protein